MCKKGTLKGAFEWGIKASCTKALGVFYGVECKESKGSGV